MFDRNVVSRADVGRLRDLNAAALNARRRDDGPADQAYDRPLGDRMMGGEAIDGQSLPATSPAPASPDSWNQKLLKYIPGEAMGTYLALDRAANTSDTMTHNMRVAVLSLVLAATVVFNTFYLRRIWKVQRSSQIAVSNLALVAYVYALGGVFAELNVAPATAQMLVVIGIATILVFFEPPESRNIPVPAVNTSSA